MTQVPATQYWLSDPFDHSLNSGVTCSESDDSYALGDFLMEFDASKEPQKLLVDMEQYGVEIMESSNNWNEVADNSDTCYEIEIQLQTDVKPVENNKLFSATETAVEVAELNAEYGDIETAAFDYATLNNNKLWEQPHNPMDTAESLLAVQSYAEPHADDCVDRAHRLFLDQSTYGCDAFCPTIPESRETQDQLGQWTNAYPLDFSVTSCMQVDTCSVSSDRDSVKKMKTSTLASDPFMKNKADETMKSIKKLFRTSHKNPMLHQFLYCLLTDKDCANKLYFCDDCGNQMPCMTQYVKIVDTEFVGVLWGLIKKNRNPDYATFARAIRKSRELGGVDSGSSGYFTRLENGDPRESLPKLSRKRIIRLGEKSLSEFRKVFTCNLNSS